MAHVKPRQIEKPGSRSKIIAKKSANGGVARKRPIVDVRVEVERELAPFRVAGASKKLRAAFAATPNELASAANAAEARRKR